MVGCIELYELRLLYEFPCGLVNCLPLSNLLILPYDLSYGLLGCIEVHESKLANGLLGSCCLNQLLNELICLLFRLHMSLFAGVEVHRLCLVVFIVVNCF